MSFLSVFSSVLHAIEAAGTLAAPIIKAYNPEIGGLIASAAQTAVLVEAAISTQGTGAMKAAIVASSTQASIDLTNQLLAAQKKAPLPANVVDTVAAATKGVVDTLNSIARTVSAAPNIRTVDPVLAAVAK